MNRPDPKRVSRKLRIYPIKKQKTHYLRIKPTWSPSHSFLVYLAQTSVVPRNVLKKATWSWLTLVNSFGIIF